jgi:hypothetical protein
MWEARKAAAGRVPMRWGRARLSRRVTREVRLLGDAIEQTRLEAERAAI